VNRYIREFLRSSQWETQIWFKRKLHILKKKRIRTFNTHRKWEINILSLIITERLFHNRIKITVTCVYSSVVGWLRHWSSYV
jgi:hypothetical protein